jgi:mRNA-degrading endonuclease toxin of MazEF toxin-antitoxin module
MNVTQWDIVRVRINPGDRDEHPAVVISPNHVARNPRVAKLNVLYCTKLPPAGEVLPTQFPLNGADGLEFRSTVDCSFYHVIHRDKIAGLCGRVSLERITALKRKVREIFGL